jgi:hypothetical protein
MAKESFKDHNFNAWSKQILGLCNQIIDHYLAQGLRLTLRQLYYQLVTRNAIKNEEKMYGKISRVLSDARLAGLVDWAAIEDRIRLPRSPNEFADLNQLMEAAFASYRLPRWRGQPHYVELWVEKDALSGVLAPLASEYHVTMMVNRGYSSQSAMYDSSKRFIDADAPEGCILFYLGDHDPSGEDMVRDIQDRLEMFGVDNLRVEKLALTMAQVRQYNPPPNPAKMSDPRAGDFVAQHGGTSWEVDALPPDVLQQLIRAAFSDVVDKRRMDKVKAQERRDKADLDKALASIRGKHKAKPDDGGDGGTEESGEEE